ncbi:hypothetical protein NKH77_05900 [Streptomyces sp. M19]
MAAVLAAQAGHLLPSEISAAYHRATAGNPTLVHALLDDSTRFSADIGEPVAGTAFRQAVLGCLSRGDAAHRRVARTLAALGDSASPGVTAQLLRLPPAMCRRPSTTSTRCVCWTVTASATRRRPRPSSVTWTIRGVRGCTARWPGCSTPAGALRLGGRASARRRPGRRTLGQTVLRAAADQALASDDVEHSTDCLRLLLRECEDQRERHALSVALARAHFRVNPAAAGTHLAPLRQAVLDDALDVRDTAEVLRHMLWQGDTELAAKAIGGLGTSASPADSQTLAEMEFIRQWFYGVPWVSHRGGKLASASMDRAVDVDDVGLGAKVALLISGSPPTTPSPTWPRPSRATASTTCGWSWWRCRCWSSRTPTGRRPRRRPATRC